jgi:hypothetical protein
VDGSTGRKRIRWSIFWGVGIVGVMSRGESTSSQVVVLASYE